MNTQNWIELIVPLIGVIVVVVSAGLTYYFAKKLQISTDERRLKKKYYLNYIQMLSDTIVSNNSEKAQDQLANAYNQLLLIGSAAAVAKLVSFHEYSMKSNSSDFKPEEDNKLLTELFKAMRDDLYKNKNVNIEYPVIQFISRNPKR